MNRVQGLVLLGAFTTFFACGAEPGRVSEETFALTTDSPVMTEGSVAQYKGFYPTAGAGSMSPTTTSDGHGYIEFADKYTPLKTHAYIHTTFSVGGFSSNPGQAWLTSAKGQGVTLDASTAAFTYSAAGQAATWVWTSGPIFAGTGTTTCSIVHN